MNAFFDLNDFRDLSILERIGVKDFSYMKPGIINRKSGERMNQVFLQFTR